MSVQRILARRASTFAPRSLSEISGLPDTATRDLFLSRSEHYSTLSTSLTDGVATVALNRPEKQNAFSMRMWEEYADCFAAASRDPEVRVAVLTGNGKHFCSGMDLGVFVEMKNIAAKESCPGRVRERLLKSVLYFQECVSAPELCSKPVLAAVDGNIIGGGIDIITACDLRYSTHAAQFSVKEVDLGIVADIGTTQRLPILVGDQRARELTYTGRSFDGGVPPCN